MGSGAQPFESAALVREALVKAMGRMPGTELVKVAPTIECFMHDPDWRVQCAAVEVLGSLANEELTKYAPVFVDLLNDPDYHVRDAARTVNA